MSPIGSRPYAWFSQYQDEPVYLCENPACTNAECTDASDVRQCDFCDKKFCADCLVMIDGLHACPEHAKCKCGQPGVLLHDTGSELVAMCRVCHVYGGEVCPSCDGRGEIEPAEDIHIQCACCEGTGRIHEEDR